MGLKIQSIPYPQYTTIERDALTNVIEGYIIKNTTTNELQVYRASEWVDIHVERASCGVVNGTLPTVSTNTDGTVDITGCTVNLRDNVNHTGRIKEYEISAVNGLVLPNNVISYICVDYNGGTPLYVVLSAAALNTIDESSIIPIHTLYTIDNLVYYIDWDNLGDGLVNKIHARLVKTERFVRESGLELSEKNIREIAITSGVTWHGAVRIEVDAFDSAIDTLMFWYKVAGVWTESTVTQYNNTQYSDGTDLQTLANNKYTVNWIYRHESEDDKITGFVLGGEYSNISDAEASNEPERIPAMGIIGFLVGRIIVKKGEDSGIIQSAFARTFSASSAAYIQDLIRAADNTQVDVSSSLTGAATVTSINTDTDISFQIINGNTDNIFKIDSNGVIKETLQTEGLKKQLSTKNSDYTLTKSDELIRIDASLNTVNITLPAILSTNHGQIYTFKTLNIANTATITCNGIDVFEDSTSVYTFSTINQSVTFICDYDNSQWVEL